MRIISRTITKPVTEHRRLVRRRKGSISYICHWIPSSGADLKKSNAKIISGSTKTYLNWINVGGKVSHDNFVGEPRLHLVQRGSPAPSDPPSYRLYV